MISEREKAVQIRESKVHLQQFCECKVDLFVDHGNGFSSEVKNHAVFLSIAAILKHEDLSEDRGVKLWFLQQWLPHIVEANADTRKQKRLAYASLLE